MTLHAHVQHLDEVGDIHTGILCGLLELDARGELFLGALFILIDGTLVPHEESLRILEQLVGIGEVI